MPGERFRGRVRASFGRGPAPSDSNLLVMHHSESLGSVLRAPNITIFRMMEQCLRRAGVSPDDDKVSLGCPRPHADTGDMVSIRFLTGQGYFAAPSVCCPVWGVRGRGGAL